MTTVFDIALVAATMLCSLVAGFLFAFAVVVMPGIKNLRDAEFLRAFQVIDRVIQNNQPLFMFVWIGSVLALIIAAGLGIFELTGISRLMMLTAVCLYVLGVQAPTMAINIPLNNQLQAFDLDSLDQQELGVAREAFEPRWNQSNNIRTAIACLVAALLIVLLTL